MNAYIVVFRRRRKLEKLSEAQNTFLVTLLTIAVLPARRDAMSIASLRRYACAGSARKYFLRRLRNDRRKSCDCRKGSCGAPAQYRREA